MTVMPAVTSSQIEAFSTQAACITGFFWKLLIHNSPYVKKKGGNALIID